MSEDTKKVEQTESVELSDKNLDLIAGGGASSINTSRSNIKNNLTEPPVPSPTDPPPPQPVV